MLTFKSLQDKHLKMLVRLEDDPASVSFEEIDSFIKEIKEAAADVISPLDREQLRASLRFWALHYYEYMGEYPDTTLRDADPEKSRQYLEKEQQPPRQYLLLGVGFVFLLTVVILGASAIVSEIASNNAIEQQQTAAALEQQTQAAEIAASTQVAVYWTQTPSPTLTPSGTPTPTHEPVIPSPTITPTLTLPPDAGIRIDIQTIANNQKVQPVTILGGTYVGLTNGSSIHVLLQPINKCGVENILVEDSSPISDPSGEWQVTVPFGGSEDLAEPEQYNIRLYFAQDETVREALEANRKRYATCFKIEDLPVGFYPYQPLLINVNRGAYENRILFASRTLDSYIFDIASTRLDGADFRLLTDTPRINEVDPDICPGNQTIVFLDKTPGVDWESIWVMDTEGDSREPILTEEGMTYERPVWSPDCRYIAYSARPNSESNLYDIYLIDFDNYKLGPLRLAAGRYQSWYPEGHRLVFNRRTEDENIPSFISINLDDCPLNFEEKKHGCSLSSLFYTKSNIPVQGLQPVISSDGQRMAFITHVMTTGDGTKYQYIRGFDLDGSGEIYNITTSAGLPTDWYPYWGLDMVNPVVYFQSWRRPGIATNIWRIGIDGTGLTAIGPGNRINTNPSQVLIAVEFLSP